MVSIHWNNFRCKLKLYLQWVQANRDPWLQSIRDPWFLKKNGFNIFSAIFLQLHVIMEMQYLILLMYIVEIMLGWKSYIYRQYVTISSAMPEAISVPNLISIWIPPYTLTNRYSLNQTLDTTKFLFTCKNSFSMRTYTYSLMIRYDNLLKALLSLRISIPDQATISTTSILELWNFKTKLAITLGDSWPRLQIATHEIRHKFPASKKVELPKSMLVYHRIRKDDEEERGGRWRKSLK